MRIIAGEARGKRILTPDGRDTRPTSDRVKESLFNILGSKIPDAKVLDLFAGTGNLGLESISRGAESCIFIDNNKASIKLIHNNINILKYEEYCEVYHNDAFTAIDIIKKRGMKFDIVFIDPPYHKDIIPAILNKIVDTDIVTDGGILAAEHDVKDKVPESISFLVKIKTAVYGNTAISFYRKTSIISN